MHVYVFLRMTEPACVDAYFLFCCHHRRYMTDPLLEDEDLSDIEDAIDEVTEAIDSVTEYIGSYPRKIVFCACLCLCVFV